MSYNKTQVGMGETVHVGVGNPGAGTNLVYSLAANYHYAIMGVYLELVTSATVATRNMYCLIRRAGATTIYRSPSGWGHTASLTTTYSFFPGAPQATGSVLANTLPLPAAGEGFFGLDSTDTFETLVQNLQAADQIQGVRIILTRWSL